jgi:hypothetical protein
MVDLPLLLEALGAFERPFLPFHQFERLDRLDGPRVQKYATTCVLPTC